jgi:hypothetical protein
LNPLEEARLRIGDRYDVRVLEPSPPAVTREPFTDDPLARGEVAAGRALVAPFETGVAGDVTWDALARNDADLASWCAARALGAWNPPPAVTPTDALVATRLSLHALAEHVLCAARHRVNGKIGLRFTRAGFGTPFFGTDEQVRVEGATLVYTAFTPARESRTDLTTLEAAASAVGIAAGAPDLFVAATPLDLDRPFDLDPGALVVFGWWFGFATSVLAQLRADAGSNLPDAPPPSLVQIWPEHFDASCDLGDTAAGHRANFGASPGDATHPEPYLYVGPWDASFLTPPVADGGDDDRSAAPPAPPDPYWNESFGSSLPYSDLLGAADARETALAFFRAGRDRLAG